MLEIFATANYSTSSNDKMSDAAMVFFDKLKIMGRAVPLMALCLFLMSGVAPGASAADPMSPDQKKPLRRTQLSLLLVRHPIQKAYQTIATSEAQPKDF